MKLAIVSERPNGHIAEVSAAMARSGHELTVYTRRDDPALPERVETPQGYSVFHVPAGPPEPLPPDELLDHMGEFARCLDARWSAERPDVAHAHFWMSGIATQLAARVHRVPTVQTFHTLASVTCSRGDAERDSLGARLKLEKLVARNADWVVATSAEEVIELTRMGRPRSRISVVPCGVDLGTFSTEGPVAQRSRLNRIVAAGRVLPRKGFDSMIEALPMIADAELVIAGGPEPDRLVEDPEVSRLRALAASLGVAERVVFTGALARADVTALLRSADVVACTPCHESSSIVALEAMACGVPVVATAVGGLRDTVVHEVTGRLVTPNRPKDCAEAVSAILRDSFLRRSLGLAGRDRACARYSWDRIAADTVRIYDRVVASRLVPAGGTTGES